MLEPRLLKAGDPERLVCRACGFVYYLDPKVAVGTIVRTEDDRIVLVRRAIEPGYGLWVFPGGYVDRGETSRPRRCARRARRRDSKSGSTGWSTSTRIPAGRSSSSCIRRPYLGGELRIDEESLEVRLFTPAEFPGPISHSSAPAKRSKDFMAGRTRPL